jgi:hypothetical protein
MSFAEAAATVLADTRRAMTAVEIRDPQLVSKRTRRAKRRRSEP